MIIAIDTGGTKTLIASFDNQNEPSNQIKFPTPKDKNEYIEIIKETLSANYSAKPIEAIVIAVPGMVQDGTAIWCNNLGWKDFPIAKNLSGILNNAPILIENDANLAGLSETSFLDSSPEISIYITISTGIGIGVINNGKIDPTMKNNEIGHSIFEYDDKQLEWEQFASGRAIKEVFGKYASEIDDEATWKNIAERISIGLLSLIPSIQSDVIIFGGSIGTYFDRYKKYLEDILADKLPEWIKHPLLIQAKHPEQAVIYGCYQYAKDKIVNK